jgi:hypothetical protein
MAEAELRRQRDLQRHRGQVRRFAVADVAAGMSLVGAAVLWGVDVPILSGWVACESNAGQEPAVTHNGRPPNCSQPRGAPPHSDTPC